MKDRAIRYWNRGLRVKRVLFFLPILFLAAGWSALLAGCSQPSISVGERAYTLVAGLNTVSRELVADNFLPDIADYATLQDPNLYPTFWEGNFPFANAPYTVTALDASVPAAVTLTIVDNQGTWGPMDAVLVMDRIGNDWFIAEMQMPPATVIVQ
jgi:hypothetical protein